MKSSKFAVALVAVLACVGLAVVAVQAVDIPVTPANASYLALPATTATVTNGEIVSISRSHYRLTANGGAASNDVSIAAPSDDGVVVVMQNVGTNLICLADSGTATLTAQFNMGTGDGLVLVSDTNTATWKEVSRANN